MKEFMLRTQRLDLKKLQQEDLENLHQLWSLPKVRKYLWDDEIVPLSQMQDVMLENDRLFEEERVGLWGIYESGKSQLIGFTGFWYFFEPPQLQLLYGLDPQFWKKGYAVEAAGEMLRYGFEFIGLKEIHAATDSPNKASQNVLNRLQMKNIANPVSDTPDTLFYRIAQQDWAQNR